jgi:hypothetical protein
MPAPLLCSCPQYGAAHSKPALAHIRSRPRQSSPRRRRPRAMASAHQLGRPSQGEFDAPDRPAPAPHSNGATLLEMHHG